MNVGSVRMKLIIKGPLIAYHLGEGRVLKTCRPAIIVMALAYHLGEGRVLKTPCNHASRGIRAYHLGEGRVLKTLSARWLPAC